MFILLEGTQDHKTLGNIVLSSKGPTQKQNNTLSASSQHPPQQTMYICTTALYMDNCCDVGLGEVVLVAYGESIEKYKDTPPCNLSIP